MELVKMDKKGLAITAAVAGVVSAALAVLRRRRRLARMPPGSFGLPLIGEMIEYIKNPATFAAERFEKYGGTFKTNVLLAPMVYVKPTPANIKLVYSMRDLGWPEHWKDVLGRSALAMVNDPLHKKIRTVSSRAFTAAQLDSYLAVYQELTQEHLQKWTKAEGLRDMRSAIKVYTFDLAQRIIMGERLSEADTARCSELFDLTIKGFESMLPYHFPGSFWSKTQRARQDLVKIYQEVIDRRRDMKNCGSLQGPSCMIDMVMAADGKDGGEPTDVELQDFCLNMIFAGHDTTLAIVQGMLHYLKAIPGVEAQLREEVDAVVDSNKPITRQLFQSLPKCKAFMMEVLRIVPPVGAIIRMASTDMKVDGYHVPAGMKVALQSDSVPQYFFGAADASEFKLSHHMDNEGNFVDRTYEKASFSSFGGGSRMCIGYKFAQDELMVFLITLLQGFDFSVETTSQDLFPIRSWRVKACFASRGYLGKVQAQGA